MEQKNGSRKFGMVCRYTAGVTFETLDSSSTRFVELPDKNEGINESKTHTIVNKWNDTSGNACNEFIEIKDG